MTTDRTTLLAMDDEELLKACRVETYRASGPGGQHRNTTETAVKLSLPETDISVTATERRSQHENRKQALRRIRLAIGVGLRCDPPASWTDGWKIGQKDRRYPSMVGSIFDALEAADYQVSTAGKSLGLSTGQLIRVLAANTDLWAKVNQERQRRQLKPLRQS